MTDMYTDREIKKVFPCGSTWSNLSGEDGAKKWQHGVRHGSLGMSWDRAVLPFPHFFLDNQTNDLEHSNRKHILRILRTVKHRGT